MSKIKEYTVHPFVVGECAKDKFESEEVVAIDIISREELCYCEPDCYLISTRLLNTLVENNVSGVNVIKHEDLKIKFSVKHNIDYKNKSIPKWHRLIPFTKTEDIKNQEIYLNDKGEMVINDRIYTLLKHKEHRIKRALIEEYEDEKEKIIIEEEKPKPVFKEENNTTKKQVITFVLIMAAVAYWFFK